jgi:hypothetical protein
VEVQPARVALMVSEQGAVDVEQPLLPHAGGQRLWVGGSSCQGQDLDMLPDGREFDAWTWGSRRPARVAHDHIAPGRRLPAELLRRQQSP